MPHTLTPRTPAAAPPVDLSHLTLDPDVEDDAEPRPRAAICFNGQLKNVHADHVQNFTDQVRNGRIL